MTTVHLLRHGEVFNPDKILYGRLPDFHLSERGRGQAVVAADSLTEHVGERIVHLRCSPLERARETIAPLAERTGVDVVVDDRLIEAGNKLEGQQVLGPRDLAKVAIRPRNLPLFLNPARPSWGEPYRQIAERVYAALLSARAVAAEHGGDAVCVSHQLPIYVTRLFLSGRPLPHSPRSRECALASVTSFTVTGPAASPVVTAVSYAEPVGADAPGEVPGA
ncbi:histidine phosphatase family protein [Jatrophihabitans sp. YIM 134969]